MFATALKNHWTDFQKRAWKRFSSNKGILLSLSLLPKVGFMASS